MAARQTLVFGVLLCYAVSLHSLPVPQPLEETTDENGVTWVGPIRKCPLGDDASLDECTKKIVDDLTPIIAAGISEIGLRQLDPFMLDKFVYDQTMGPIKIAVHAKNIQLHDMVKYRTAKFNVDTTKRIMSFVYEVPLIRINANYKLGGNVFFFPLTGSGPANIDIHDLRAEGHMKFKKVYRPDGTQIMQLEETIMDKFTVGGMNLRLRGLFNGNPMLSALVHRIGNQYGAEVFDVIKPDISKFAGDILTNKVVNPVLENLPYLTEYVPDE